MDYRGNDGRGSGRQQSKKSGLKKLSANKGGGVGWGGHEDIGIR